MQKVKIGIIGCGNISGIYLENLTRTFDNTEVFAVSDISEERMKTAAETYGVPNQWTAEQILSSEEIEIVLNLTTPGDHFRICKLALEHGKHVYVEKPLSLLPEQGRQLVELAREKGLLLGGAPDTFLGAGLQTCRKLIDDGYIGDPVAATAFMMSHGHESWHPNPAFYYQAGGGPMFDMGPYYITALVSLLGPVQMVAGMTGKALQQRTITSQPLFGEKIDVQVPTHAAGTLRFCSGAIGTMITSFDVWSSTLPHIEIYGTQGTLLVPDPNNFGGPILLRPAGGSEFKEIPLLHQYAENTRGIGVADLAHCVRSGGTPRAGGELTNHVLEIMHAFHSSSDSGAYAELTTTCEQPRPLKTGLIKGYLE
ncbi:Gfo/Idh/MocA family protein [Saccharibacillus kuerlensis]|uniref:Dehydrogenase n=1 Tax=Saccharibacillus kuerlensis TaxID=459527 RepID=A0ABQ2L619_9BACL|nr:Gfo/Idh/MocA family oxidoreductase [Saccharibacillus kuerlensis]GGO04704.1 dehydrogenase [Saccharibacillus kuerlensis]